MNTSVKALVMQHGLMRRVGIIIFIILLSCFELNQTVIGSLSITDSSVKQDTSGDKGLPGFCDGVFHILL